MEMEQAIEQEEEAQEHNVGTDNASSLNSSLLSSQEGEAIAPLRKKKEEIWKRETNHSASTHEHSSTSKHFFDMNIFVEGSLERNSFKHNNKALKEQLIEETKRKNRSSDRLQEEMNYALKDFEIMMKKLKNSKPKKKLKFS